MNSTRFNQGVGTGMIGQTVAGVFIDPAEALLSGGEGAVDGALNGAIDSSAADASAAGSVGDTAAGTGGGISSADNIANNEAEINAEASDAAASPSDGQSAVQQTDISPTPQAPESPAPAGDDAGTSGDGTNAPSCATAPNSFTGQTSVLMADGTTKPIDQITIGDQIANTVPGQSGTQTNTVTNVITTFTDHDFVDVTVAPITSSTAADTAVASSDTGVVSDRTSTTTSVATSGTEAQTASSKAASTQSAAAQLPVSAASTARPHSSLRLLVAAGVTALALASGAATHTAQSTPPPAWSQSTAAPAPDSQTLAQQATAAATFSAESIGGGTITTTFLHPFYDITQTSFVQAQDLHVGDILQTSTGEAEVTNLHLFHADTTTYDLTIGALHTFYVVAGDTPVLVHNCTTLQDVANSLPSRSDGDPTTGQVVNIAEDGTVTTQGGQIRSGMTDISGDINDFLMDSPDIENPSTGEHASISHVETKLAWLMRGRGITNSDVVINNADGPCEGPFSCDAAVSAILSEGSSLTVWYPDGAGGLSTPVILSGIAARVPEG